LKRCRSANRIDPTEVDVGRIQVVDAFIIADVIVMLDEGADLPFDIVVEQIRFLRV
jgi:hypothetical protein